jgi:hypothetical protein
MHHAEMEKLLAFQKNLQLPWCHENHKSCTDPNYVDWNEFKPITADGRVLQ